MNKDSALSKRAQKLRDIHLVTSTLMHLAPESAHGSAGARAKENTAEGRCHSRGTCTESPGCICFGMGSKDCHEQSSVRAALLPLCHRLSSASLHSFEYGQHFKTMLRQAMEKQLFHRCKHSYLSCLGLCQAVAANQLHSK